VLLVGGVVGLPVFPPGWELLLPCGVVGLPVFPPGCELLLPPGGVVGAVWVPLPDGGVGVVGLPVVPPGWELLLPCGGVELLAPGCVVPEELSRFLRKP
jgi:hypothetical protein